MNLYTYLTTANFKTIIIVFILFLSGTFSSSLYGQLVGLDWGASMGAGATDEGNGIAVDPFGNVYTTGNFKGTVDFDPGPGVFNLSAALNSYDIFIQKLDPNGNLLWAKSLGGQREDKAYAIATDSLGNVFITGSFMGTVDFDPGSAVLNLTSNSTNYPDILVLKLDANGNFGWVETLGNNWPDEGNSITTDPAGNVYVTGYFYRTIDFDPGPAVLNLTSSSANFPDIFVQKLAPNGNLIWAKRIGGAMDDRGKSIAVNEAGEVHIMGRFQGTVDFNSGPGNTTLVAGVDNLFILKLDPQGDFKWAKKLGGYTVEYGNFIDVDVLGNVYATGWFSGTVDFDPGVDTFYLDSRGWSAIFILKLDKNGNFTWANGMASKSITSHDRNHGYSITTDQSCNVYSTGFFQREVDFDPGPDTLYLSSPGRRMYVQKLDCCGDLIWVKKAEGFPESYGFSVAADEAENVYLTGYFWGTLDFDPSLDTFNLSSNGYLDIFTIKLYEGKVTGQCFYDLNQNCLKDTNEIGLANRRLIINPGQIVVSTNEAGFWRLDSLPLNNYSITMDTSDLWTSTCPNPQTFTITNSNQPTQAPNLGFVPAKSCTAPTVSIVAPKLEPGYSNQRIYVQACNQSIATDSLYNAYVIVELEDSLTVQSSSNLYTNLGNNRYRIDLGTLAPGSCVDIWMACFLTHNAIVGRSLCMNAKLYPINLCQLDSLPNLYPTTGITPCISPYDDSDLRINSSCHNEQIEFTIKNRGTGDMTCFSQVRLYIDGHYVWMDSIQLLSGDSLSFNFNGDGRTWRMEVDQHPLQLGNSQPSSTIELCGSATNWTSNLVNLLPQDDANPMVDIYCSLIGENIASTEKAGYPLGLGSTHDILPNTQLEYLIRFQNTRFDTAHTLVVRDTLSADLDIFSVVPGVASHDYTFRMYGTNILEWTFCSINLPDSALSSESSRIFLTFTVDQKLDLPPGTIIENKADVYIDYHPPTQTNTTQHRIVGQQLSWDGIDTINASTCDSSVLINNLIYHQSGVYWQPIQNNGLDSLYRINVNLLEKTDSTFAINICDSFDLNGQVYYNSGTYTQTISNALGCDSVITLNLTIEDSSSSAIDTIVCHSYTAADGQLYNTSGQYMILVPNLAGCDSVISLNLTVDTLANDSIIQSGINLLAYSSGLTYQWLDCNNGNSPILGATHQQFTPLSNGRYAVDISNGSCITRSNCINIVGLESTKLPTEWQLKIYPTPVRTMLYMEQAVNREIQIKVLDQLGRTLLSTTTTERITAIDLSNKPTGIYYLSINNGQETISQKIIKQ